MALNLAIHCHPENPTTGTGGGDNFNLALKLEQIAQLLSEMKEGIVEINVPEGESINVDLAGVEDLLGSLLNSVNGKLDAIASTNNAIKISMGEANTLLNQINLTVSGIIGAVNSISETVADGFSDLFGRWDTVFGMIKSEFDETQAAIRETTTAQLQTTKVLERIEGQLTNKEVEEISKDIIIDCEIDIQNKIEVVIPAGAITINVYFDYDDCKGVDRDRAAMKLVDERYLAVVTQVRKDGSETTKAKITPRAQGAWTGDLKSLGSNINTKLPETHVVILKSFATFTIEAIYAKVVSADITFSELEMAAAPGQLGEEDVLDVPAEDVNEDVPAEDTAPAEDAPAETAPAEDAPESDAPAEDAPAEDAPAEDAPADDAPADDAPADDAPAS